MPLDMEAMFCALADPTRRAIFERIVIRPRRIVELGDLMPVTRQAVTHHVGVLKRAGLVRYEGRCLAVVLEALPAMRTYLDRLWLEASLGDAWLAQRGAQQLAPAAPQRGATAKSEA